MWKDPEVGHQYEYHESGYCAIVEVVNDTSTATYKQWKIKVVDPVAWPAPKGHTFTFGYDIEYGYRMGTFYPVDSGDPYLPPEIRNKRGH